MAKVLSPLGGAAAQFFTDNGVPLSGGKLHTYAAGTTTPLATYTTSVGNVAHPNPIVLDAAGRVPGGQVWLDLAAYKVILTDSADVTIATFDLVENVTADRVPFGDTTVSAALTALQAAPAVVVPAGSVTMFAGAAAPTGWLLCDGSVKSAADYSDLFTAIGSTFNTGGEAAGTFRLPDLRGRAPIGAGTGTDLTERALGAKGGAEIHNLVLSELPGHSHTISINDPGHHHLDPTWNGAGGAPYEVGSTGTTGFDYTQSADTSTNTTGITATASYEGGNGSHNNMQPFLTLNFIIRT